MSPSSDEEFKALRLRLVGVVNSNHTNSPKALISIVGGEEDFVVGEGDLVGGYTVMRIGPDQIELEKGKQRHTLTVRNLRWVKANPKSKVFPTYQPSRVPVKAASSRRIASSLSAKSKTLASAASKSLSSLSTRPNFIRPMVGRITSRFGTRLIRRKTRNGGLASINHKGIDIAAPHGTSVYASAAGTVVTRGYSWAKGRYIVIRHTGGYETLYYHLSWRYATAGQVVKAGQRIGREGRTGISTGPHLHFELRRYGTAYDPAKYIPSLKKR